MKEEKSGGLIGSTLLIAGSAIGAGMIGLPVVSAATGFIPSSLAMILAYLFATATGLLLVEGTLWFDKKVHLLTLAQFALGKWGRWVAWSFFLFLFYCIFVAYIEGGGQIFTQLLSSVLNTKVPREMGIFACVLVVGSIVYIGTHAVSYISRVFLLGLALSYGGLIVLGMPHIRLEQLMYQNWAVMAPTIPILFICFGYQNLVPTVIYYAKKNVSVIRRAIFLGNLIPFLIYSLWDFVILGILADPSPRTLEKIVDRGEMVTGLLERTVGSESVLFFAMTFTFFGLVTPFMTNTLAFVHFFKDGFKNFPRLQFDSIIYACVLIPPTLFALLYPNLFLSALSFAGGFIDAVLFGLLPVTIIYMGRYRMDMQGPYQMPGGKYALLSIFVFSLAVISYRLSQMF